ncbi:MAG: iron ABC transporter permease [Deltaproteobacteria bacterium]|nr:iron ABC transporter permease [Deltaproteobacteria bacterium]
MHLANGRVSRNYKRYIHFKLGFMGAALLLLCLGITISIFLGAAGIPFPTVAKTLLGISVSKRFDMIVWNIRLPQALAAVTAGAGLAVAGGAMQSILRNPLGSPFTLGISQAAAFGAAFAVMMLGGGVMQSTQIGSVTVSNPYLTTLTAYVCSMLAAGVIILVSRLRGATPEVMVLTGVALGTLFTAGTMFLQYFADDVQLAAMIFWTFGDVARASWAELGLLALVTGIGSVYLLYHSWDYNAIDAGDETAKGLGVRVERVRMVGMLMASLITAVIVSFLGIIGFVGLVVPHMVRRIIGGDNRFLMPATIICGALMLLLSDTVARLILAPHVLPVSVLTAFLGAPAFIYLIVRGGRR